MTDWGLRLKPTDIVVFEWEKETLERRANKTTREDVERIMARFGND